MDSCAKNTRRIVLCLAGKILVIHLNKICVIVQVTGGHLKAVGEKNHQTLILYFPHFWK